MKLIALDTPGYYYAPHTEYDVPGALYVLDTTGDTIIYNQRYTYLEPVADEEDAEQVAIFWEEQK